MENQNYFSGLVGGIKTLLTGLKTTMREFWTPKITERYPENRKEHKMFERFRGQLILPHNELNQHKCVGCGVCQNVCPNDTIIIHPKPAKKPTTARCLPMSANSQPLWMPP